MRITCKRIASIIDNSLTMRDDIVDIATISHSQVPNRQDSPLINYSVF